MSTLVTRRTEIEWNYLSKVKINSSQCIVEFGSLSNSDIFYFLAIIQ
jgi:hypothetical protein